MKRERVRSKHGFKGFGTFILGWFIGLVSTLGILFGIGFWAYTSVSVKRIEKWTKSDITDNKGIEDLTIQKAVGIIKGITANNKDAYTLANLEEDFGLNLLGDSIYGVGTDIIKNAPLKNLKQAFNDTINTATFNNVLSFMNVEQENMGMLNTILETEKEYFIKYGKLYTDKEGNIEAEFKYEIKAETVEFANGSHTIFTNDGVKSIKPRLRDLPLNTALKSFEDSTKNLKIYEILDFERTGTEGNYTYTDNGNAVSGVMANIAGYTIDDLSDNEKFNKIYIYEVMGYKDLGNGEFSYINDSDEEVKVTGAIKAIAGMTIGEISKPETINNLEIYKIMDYYYNESDKNYYEEFDGTNYNKKVTGTMKTLAGKTIEDLSNPDLINNLQVWEVMGFDQEGEDPNFTYRDNGKEVTGIMATLVEKKISELDDSGAFNDVTVADAMGYHLNTADGRYYKKLENNIYSDEVTGIYAHIADAKVSGLSERIKTLSVGKVLDIEYASAPGIFKALYTTTIDGLSKQETIDGIYIWQVMDYTEAAGGGYTYKDNAGNAQPVTGAMKVLAGKTIKQLSQPNTINDLKVWEVMGYYENGGKYYTTFDGTNYSGEVTGPIKAMAGISIGKLNDETVGIKSIELGSILDVDYDTAPAVVKALYSSPIGGLNTDISNLQVYEIMGYTREGDGPFTYRDENGDVVTGIMGAIAGANINDIGSTVETLKAVDVFDKNTTTILKLFSDDELNGTNGKTAITVMDLPNELTNKINSAKIKDLVDKGIITGVDTTTSYYQNIQGLTLVELLNGN